MATLDIQQDSYVFWLLVSLIPAGIIATMTYSVAEAAVTAIVLATLAYFLFNYPF